MNKKSIGSLYTYDDVVYNQPIQTLMVQPEDTKCDNCRGSLDKQVVLIPLFNKDHKKIYWYCPKCFNTFILGNDIKK